MAQIKLCKRQITLVKYVATTVLPHYLSLSHYTPPFCKLMEFMQGKKIHVLDFDNKLQS